MASTDTRSAGSIHRIANSATSKSVSEGGEVPLEDRPRSRCGLALRHQQKRGAVLSSSPCFQTHLSA